MVVISEGFGLKVTFQTPNFLRSQILIVAFLCVPMLSKNITPGSGFCIDAERRVLITNAHCVEWHAQAMPKS
jgi:hypothetical protein